MSGPTFGWNKGGNNNQSINGGGNNNRISKDQPSNQLREALLG